MNERPEDLTKELLNRQFTATFADGQHGPHSNSLVPNVSPAIFRDTAEDRLHSLHDLAYNEGCCTNPYFIHIRCSTTNLYCRVVSSQWIQF